MTASLVDAVRFTCDRLACGVSELLPMGSRPPDGWVTVTLRSDFTFCSEECLARWVESIAAERSDEGSVFITTIGGALSRNRIPHAEGAS